jgi:hypothetical protein
MKGLIDRKELLKMEIVNLFNPIASSSITLKSVLPIPPLWLMTLLSRFLGKNLHQKKGAIRDSKCPCNWGR